MMRSTAFTASFTDRALPLPTLLALASERPSTIAKGAWQRARSDVAH
jgi:hypothetical protein